MTVARLKAELTETEYRHWCAYFEKLKDEE